MATKPLLHSAAAAAVQKINLGKIAVATVLTQAKHLS
jgi:hypothetical protein